MAIVCWDGSLKVGVDLVDTQHRYLFEIINSMQAKIARGDTESALADGLDSMRTYARFHFESEERLLAEHGYPDLAGHKALHREFLAQVDRLAAAPGSPALACEALGFLLTWLVGHIQAVDGRFAPFLAELGVG